MTQCLQYPFHWEYWDALLRVHTCWGNHPQNCHSHSNKQTGSKVQENWSNTKWKASHKCTHNVPPCSHTSLWTIHKARHPTNECLVNRWSSKYTSKVSQRWTNKQRPSSHNRYYMYIDIIQPNYNKTKRSTIRRLLTYRLYALDANRQQTLPKYVITNCYPK